MLGTGVTGSPNSVYQVAGFATRAKLTLENDVVATLERVIRTIEEDWTDDAGESLRLILLNGLANALRLQDTMDELHDVVADCGEALGNAQWHMGNAEQLASEGGLLVQEGRIYPPIRIPADIPVYDDSQHQDLLRGERLREDFERKKEAYEEARTKVEAGCQALEGGLERLESMDGRWDIPYFTLADITAGGLAFESWSRSQQRGAGSELYHDQSREMRRQAGDLARTGNRHTNELQQLLEKWSRDDATRSTDLSRSARSLGLLSKVLKAAGPVLAVGNVTYEVYVEGTPWQKSVTTAGVGLAGSVAAYAVVGLFVGTPVGWGGIIVAGLFGLWLENFANEKYDYIEPARFRLARSTSGRGHDIIGGS